MYNVSIKARKGNYYFTTYYFPLSVNMLLCLCIMSTFMCHSGEISGATTGFFYTQPALNLTHTRDFKNIVWARAL